MGTAVQVSDVYDFYRPESFKRMMSITEVHETPILIVDLETVARAYDEISNGFPYASIYYAAKANPEDAIINLLKEKGSSFDIASTFELDKLLKHGIDPSRLTYGNTIKKARDIRKFYECGVRLFASDSEADIRNIAQKAPGSKVYVRILTEGSSTADWPLSGKFGCQPDMAMDLLILARDLGLVPYGVSFHVGSQQREISAWDSAIAKVKVIFERLRVEDDIHLQCVNLGGGFPANYLNRTNDLTVYASEIRRFLVETFGNVDEASFPRIILEPGRSLVANAGLLASEVVSIARKSRTAVERWVFTDVGKFSGLIETMDEAIKFPLWTHRTGVEEDVILAGPTCDSADILYQHHKYSLPLDLNPGDRIYWFSTGAYTASYSSIEFNGFPPLKCLCI